jgi:predicted O-methyltransferase YrrM
MYNETSKFPVNNGIPGIEFIYPREAENKTLDSLENSYIKISEMQADERTFLNALILRHRPRKLLEIGVSSGGSSIIMLNAIKDFQDAKLYSIDLYENLYKKAGLKTGYFADNYPALKMRWELFTGGLALKFMDRIGSGIDFCFIDTAHCNPGEIFDILMVLPFLNDDAVIVFHDVKLHTVSRRQKESITNNLLISSIGGKKYVQGNFVKSGRRFFPNIAGIKIGKDAKSNVFEVFNLLTLKWSYLPSAPQQKEMLSWFEKYYGGGGGYYIKYLEDVFMYQEKLMSSDIKYRIKNTIKKIIGIENIKRIRTILKK